MESLETRMKRTSKTPSPSSRAQVPWPSRTPSRHSMAAFGRSTHPLTPPRPSVGFFLQRFQRRTLLPTPGMPVY